MVDAALLMYIELHLHTNYSLLDGASHPEELIEAAARMGYRALAITDHDNLHAAMIWAQACERHGIQPITGVELTIAEDPDHSPRHHLTLLAENRQGYANLCRLVSRAHGHGLASQKQRETRRRDPCVPLQELRHHCDGVACLTGCREGELAHHAQRGDVREAERVLRRWQEWFDDRLYVEIQDNLVHGDRARNRLLSELAQRCGVPLVATGNVHYHDRSRHRLQDAMVAIRHRLTLEASHRVRRPNSHFHLRDPTVQERRFARWPEAVANTMRIADRCRFTPTADLGYRLPSPSLKGGETPDQRLSHLCREALDERYATSERPQAEARLDEELRLIAHHGLAGFFLVYHEVFRLAREVATELRQARGWDATTLPPGRGRGSSVGSIVCYLIGLSHIDPVRNRLFLGRFLNEEMASLPDIDLDFARDIRARLFERVYDHWGIDHAALVAIFPTYRIRSAIRDLGKVLGLPSAELDRLAKLAEGYGSARDVREEMQRSERFRSLVEAPGWRELIDLAQQLAGFPRHLSQHVGGMVISSEPLVNCVPIEPAAWPNRYICHWDKDSVDDARMVKIDFLGLGMLSLVEECLEHIQVQRGEAVDLSRIDFGDSDVYDGICRGDTIGVFQIESRAQASMLPRSQPRCLDDLTAQVAIIRPGPIVGGAVHPYLERRERMRRDPHYVPEMPHESLRDVLGESLGVILYQEQVVQVAQIMGGFSPGEAETFRRAMGRHTWPREEEGYRARFVAGALAAGVDEAVALSVFANLAGFAEFGFPKSHSAAFGLLAYQSAWLRHHYPPEFYCALYNSWPMGFYPPHVVTNDARRHGVSIRRPDVNRSGIRCSVEEGAVRLGLAQVRDVGEVQATWMVRERQHRGPFLSLFHCVQRTGLSRRALENLIRVGAFEQFGLNRRELLWQLGLFGLGLSASPEQRAVRQLRLALPTEQDHVSLADLTSFERMATDYAVLGLSPDAHPMHFLRSRLGSVVQPSACVRERRRGGRVTVAGLVTCRQRPMTAQGVVFLALEDEDGLVNVVVSEDLYERHRVMVRTSPFLQVAGVVQGHAGDVPLLRAERLLALDGSAALAMPDGKSWG